MPRTREPGTAAARVAPAERRTLRSWLRELLLTGAALAGVVCLLAASASFALHLRPLVFRSGSMGPAIQTGALGLAREVPAASVVVGDVVSVPNAAGVRITHRVRSATTTGSVTTLVLQGDANPVPDAEPYVVTRVDRLVLHVNHLGYVVAWFGHRYVVFAAGVLVGVLGAYAFRPGGAVPQERPRRGPPSGVLGAVLVVVLLAGLLARHTTTTMAAFTDGGRAVTGQLKTYTVPTPPTLSCTTGIASITFTWTAVAVPLSLTVQIGTKTTNVPLAAGQSSYTLTPELLGSGTGTAQLWRSDVYSSTTWTASGNTRTLSIFVGVLASCQ